MGPRTELESAKEGLVGNMAGPRASNSNGSPQRGPGGLCGRTKGLEHRGLLIGGPRMSNGTALSA